MEIDFQELEDFEKKLEQKRSNAITTNSTAPSNDDVDELDVYLNELAISLKASSVESEQHASITDSEMMVLDTSQNCSSSSANNSTTTIQSPSATTSFPLLVYGLLSILCFINSVVHCKPDSFFDPRN